MSILLEQRFDLRRRAPEVSSEFDFLVSDLRDLAQRAGEIGLHQVTNGVKLKTDFLQLSLRCEENSIGQSISVRDPEGGDAERREECAAGM